MPQLKLPKLQALLPKAELPLYYSMAFEASASAAIAYQNNSGNYCKDPNPFEDVHRFSKKIDGKKAYPDIRGCYYRVKHRHFSAPKAQYQYCASDSIKQQAHNQIGICNNAYKVEFQRCCAVFVEKLGCGSEQSAEQYHSHCP